MFVKRVGREDKKFFYTFPNVNTNNITCIFCNQPFVARDLRYHPPLLLACGNAFCDHCASRAKDHCDLCAKQNYEEEPKNGKLPLINVYVMGLISAHRNIPAGNVEPEIQFQTQKIGRSKRRSATLDLCRECDKEADLQCLDCISFLCSLCFDKVHRRDLRTLNAHRKVWLSNTLFETKFCREHNMVIDYYCDDCSCCVCTRCALDRHPKHNYLLLTVKNEEFLMDFQTVHSKLNETLQRVRQSQKKVHNILVSSDRMRTNKSVEATITRHFAHLHGILQNTEKRMLDKLHEPRNRSIENLHDIEQRLKNQYDELQSGIRMASETKKIMETLNLKEVISKLTKLANSPCHLVEDTIANLEETKFITDPSIFERIEKHCKIEVPEMSSYSLRTYEYLPMDYELESIDTDESSRFSQFYDDSQSLESSRMSRTSSCTSLSSVRSDTSTVLKTGRGVVVEICHIVHPSNFYVRRISSKPQIMKLSMMLEDYLEEFLDSPIPTEIEKSRLYVVKRRLNDTLYRGRVIAIEKTGDSETYEIFDIDNGRVELNVPKERIRNITDSLIAIESMLIECTLLEIFPKDGKWSPEACRIMAEYAGSDNSVMMHIVNIQGNTHYVDLTRTHISIAGQNKCSIRELLLHLNYGSFNTQHQLLRTVPRAVKGLFYEKMVLEDFYFMECSHVQSPDCIYVQKTGDNFQHLKKLSQEISHYYNSKVAFDEGIIHAPEIGIPCVAEKDIYEWHRAIIIGIPGSRMVEVCFVDNGDTAVMDYDKIRRIHSKFMTTPAQAMKVSLVDIKSPGDNWSQEAIALTKRHIAKKTVKVFPYEKKDDTYKVSLYTNNGSNVATILVTKDLAISTGPRSSTVFESSEKLTRTNNKPSKIRNNRTKKAKKHKLKPTSNIVAKASKFEPTKDPFKMRVKIVKVISPDIIYVADPNYDNLHEQMMAQMQVYYNRYEHPSSDIEWKIGHQCAVYSECERSFCRGKVIGLSDPDEAEVFLYDLAVTDNVRIADLQVLKKTYWKYRTYAFKVKLAGIYPCGGSNSWLSSSCEKLKDLIAENQSSKFHICKVDNNEEDLGVDLWMEQVKYDGPLAPPRIEMNCINRLLVDIGLALPIQHYNEKKTKILAVELERQVSHTEEAEKSEGRYYIPNGNFAEKSLNDEESCRNSDSDGDCETIGSSNEEDDAPYDRFSPTDERISTEHDKLLNDSLHEDFDDWLPAEPIKDHQFKALTTNLDNECRLYVQTTRYHAFTVRRIQADLRTKYANTTPEPEDLVWNVGDLCIAQYHADQDWYRAKVTKAPKKGMIEVQFVDYGNIEECEMGTLRKRLTFTDYPRQGVLCVIAGLFPNTPDNKWLTPDLDIIHAHVVGRLCEITVLKTYPDHLVVSVIMDNPRGRELRKFIIEDLKIDARIEFVHQESSSDETSSTTDKSGNVIVDGYYEGDHFFLNNTEDYTQKRDEISENHVCKERNNNEENDETNQNDFEENETDDLNDEDSDVNNDNVADGDDEKEEYKVPMLFNSVSTEDSSKTILNDDHNVNLTRTMRIIDDEDDIPIASTTITRFLDDECPSMNNGSSNNIEDDSVIAGTANFTRSADEIIECEQEALDQLDSISLSESTCMKGNDLITSTPFNDSFEGVERSCWKGLKIPEDIDVLKSQLGVFVGQDFYFHFLNNKKSQILMDQREQYDTMSKNMQIHADEQPILKNFEKGTPCCARFTDGLWYRCEVINCESDPYELGYTLEVRFVDYGNTALRKSSEVRTLQEEWLDAPVMCLRCILWQIVPNCAKCVADNEMLIQTWSKKPLYIKIMRRYEEYCEVEVYDNKACTKLIYQNLIDNGLYEKNDCSQL